MNIKKTHAGSNLLDCCQLSIKHNLIDLALSLSKAPISGVGASYIGTVELIFRAGIDKQQVTIADLAIIIIIMESGGIWAGADDRSISRGKRAGATKMVFYHGFYLKLIHTGTHYLHRFRMSLGGNICRIAHQDQFFQAFKEAHLMENFAGIDNAIRP